MKFSCSSFVLLASLGFLSLSSWARAETVWWEAETAKDTNMPVVAGDPTELSGGSWLQGEVKDGLYAEYNVSVKDGGRYDFLARRFWLHGAFRWKFDDGAWANVEGLNQDVVDQVALAKGKESPLCWIDLGYVTLAPGAHTLRIEVVTQTTYQFNHSFTFDCFALSNDGFAPKGINPAGGPHVPPVSLDEKDYGKFLPRTMALLESSNANHHTPISILFYGQSIIANSNIDQLVVQYLHTKYPYAEIHSKKLAIGGYQAPILRRTAWQDLYPENPDLVIFHDYGGETGELEEIYRALRANMTTEVLTWTHHVDNLGAGIDKQRDASSVILRQLAAKYGFEMADVRVLWKEHLKETHEPASDYLADKIIHLNSKGSQLLFSFLEPHFRVDPDAPLGWKNHVHTLSFSESSPQVQYEAASWNVANGGLVSAGTKPLKITFFGNRLDLVGLAGKKPGSAKILLDGHAPSSLPDTLAASRSDKAPFAWWPAISLVKLGQNTLVEHDTMNFHDVAPDGSSFAFNLVSSVSGDEGAGKSGVDFVAKSGRVSIPADDIALSTVKKIMKKNLPPTFAINWDIYSMSKDIWRSPGVLAVGKVPQETVIRCWTDGPHTVEIVPNGDGPVALQEALTFSPSGGQAP